jgi:hypothetical protein
MREKHSLGPAGLHGGLLGGEGGGGGVGDLLGA